MKQPQMQNYHDLMGEALHTGYPILNTRTGEICHTIIGRQITYDLADGFPAPTSKKLAFKSARGELLGFCRGYTNAADFRALGCGVWDKDANESVPWLENPYREGTDHTGRIYGAQWTDWKDRRIVDSPKERDRLLAIGFKVRMTGEEVTENGKKTEWLMERSINQLENALRTIITNPSDRRIIVSAWNIAEFDQMCLPPCHVDYRFVPIEATRELHVVMTMRSTDTFLGLGFNICTTSLFLATMARLAGYTPRTVTIQMTNVHVYDGHRKQVEEQLSRTHFAPPRLVISERVQPVKIDEIPGAFTRIEPDDLTLEGYQSHDAIKAVMATGVAQSAPVHNA